MSLSLCSLVLVLAATVLTTVSMHHDVVGSLGLVGAAKEGAIAGRSVSVWLVSAVIPVFGDAMWAGKALGVLAGISIVVSMTRLLGPWAGLWILGSPALINASIHGDPDAWVVGAMFGGAVLWRTGFRSLAAVSGALTVGLLFDVPVPTDRQWDALVDFGAESADSHPFRN